MAHNFRKQFVNTWPNEPIFYISKSGSELNDGTTPEKAKNHPRTAQGLNGSGVGPNDGRNMFIDGRKTLYIGTGHYQGEITNGLPARLIADGKVVWYVNGELILGTKIDGMSGFVDGVVFRFIDKWQSGSTGGGFAFQARSSYQSCFFEFKSNADVNAIIVGENYPGANINFDCIFKKFNGACHDFIRCYLIQSVVKNCQVFRGSYIDPTSSVELVNSTILNTPDFQNCNIQGLIRVKDDSFGYTDITTFKENYGLQGRADLFGRDPRFNKFSSDDLTLKIDSPHLDFQIGPSFLRYSLMYYIDTTASPGDLITVNNTKLKSTADGSLVTFRDIGGFTINTSGGLVIAPNSQSNYEGYYTTNRIPIAATTQKIKRLPVVSGLNFDSDYPASSSGFSSVQPEVFNNNVPDYSNSASNGGRTPNRLTVQARFSTLANPDETNNEHWLPSTGQYFDFEIDEEPFYDGVTGYGSGHPLFDPLSLNVRPMLARYIQVRYKSRNDYYSK